MPDNSPRLGGQNSNDRREPALTGDRALLHALEMLNAPDEQTRTDAAFALAELGDERAIEQLLRIIRDPEQDWELQERAAWSLTVFGRAAIPHLMSLIPLDTNDDDHFLWRTGLKCLGWMGRIDFPELAPEICLLLTDMLEHAEDDIGNEALDQLGPLRHPDAIPALCRVGRDTSREQWLRDKSIRSFLYFDDPQARAECIAFIRDQSLSVSIRSCAIYALRYIGDETCYPGLADTLQEVSPELRHSAADVLGNTIALKGAHTVTHAVLDALVACLDDTAEVYPDEQDGLAGIAPAAYALESVWIPMVMLRNDKDRSRRFRYTPKVMNTILKQLYDEDVNEHKQGHRDGTPEFIAMRQRDAERRARVASMREAELIITAADYYHAAQIMQHGDTPDDAWEAHLFAMRAAGMGEEQARWLAAASYDRWRMYNGEPQKYGTQIVSDGRRLRLWDVDPATTDRERARWGVPALERLLRNAEYDTFEDPPGPLPRDIPHWLREAIARWRKEEGW